MGPARIAARANAGASGRIPCRTVTTVTFRFAPSTALI
jgi:hypothetical protein